MSAVDTLRVLGGRGQIGWIRRDGDTVSFSDPTAEKLFAVQRRALGASASATFDALAGGWSNGYVTIKH